MYKRQLEGLPESEGRDVLLNNFSDGYTPRLIALSGYNPVSYTHLDVYKRQAYIELGVNDTKRTAYLLSEELKLLSFRIMDTGEIRIYDKPVSYTHLKRPATPGNGQGTAKPTASARPPFNKF